MFTQLLLLFWLMRPLEAYCNFILNGSNLFSGYQISRGVFQTLTIAGPIACQLACLHRNKCISLSYNRNTMQCSMGKYNNSKVATGNGNDIYMTIDWNRTLPVALGPCRFRPCSLTEMCVPLRDGSHACVTETKSVDLTVLIDLTYDTGQSGFQNIIDCVKLVLGHLDDVRLAVVYFGNEDPEVKFKLDQYVDKEEQINALESLSHRYMSGSYLAVGVQTVHTAVYNGSEGDRPGVKDVLLIMVHADDVETPNLADSVTAAKNDDIHIIAVGIKTRWGHGREILNMIVSEPLQDNQLIAESYGALLDMDQEIADTIERSIL